MRNSLGRFFIAILMFFHLNVMATTYEWSVESDKTRAMTYEAIYLKYICRYSDAAELYVIEFNPVIDNENYKIEILSESEKILNGKKINSFEFVAHVKKAGSVSFVFDTIMKKTNKDSIQNTVLGRDNSDYEEFSQKIIRQKAINIDVEKSPTNLVGLFSIQSSEDEEKRRAYEPYHLEIRIEGRGSFQTLKPIEFEIEGVKVFAQKPIEKIKLTKNGYKGSWSQKFAFVGDKDFTIPRIDIEYFNLESRTKEYLSVEERRVKVLPAYKKEELLDVVEENFEFDYSYLYYLLIFISGYLFAQIKFKSQHKDTHDSSFTMKVQDAKSLEELMILLVLEDSKRYEAVISDIESKKVVSLSKCKKRVLD